MPLNCSLSPQIFYCYPIVATLLFWNLLSLWVWEEKPAFKKCVLWSVGDCNIWSRLFLRFTCGWKPFDPAWSTVQFLVPRFCDRLIMQVWTCRLKKKFMWMKASGRRKCGLTKQLWILPDLVVGSVSKSEMVQVHEIVLHVEERLILSNEQQ
jgi:hypothetical protein